MVTYTEIFIESKVVEHEILKIKCLKRFTLRRIVTELSAIQNLDGGSGGLSYIQPPLTSWALGTVGVTAR